MMGWWTDGEGAKGFFSDDTNVPADWKPMKAPDEAREAADPLDHDGNGAKGGSLPKAKRKKK